VSDLQPGNAGATGSIQSEAVNVVARPITRVANPVENKKARIHQITDLL